MAYDVECAVFLQFVRVLWTVPVGFFRRFFLVRLANNKSHSRRQNIFGLLAYARVVPILKLAVRIAEIFVPNETIFNVQL